jgi:hypothetical protein
MLHTIFFKRAYVLRISYLAGLMTTLVGNTYAYDFNGSYSGSQKGIIKLQVMNCWLLK